MTDSFNGESFIKSGFIIEFDGSQPEINIEEQQEAAEYFQCGFESILAQHADRTEGHLFTYLRLKSEFEDGTSLTFVVTSSIIGKTVGLIAKDNNGNPRKTFNYTVGPNEEVVRRIDVGDVAKRQKDGTPGSARYVGNPPQGYILSDAEENTRLEDQLGLNNQPVGLEEVIDLFTLIEQSSPDL
jgi:hypothetical protein